MHQPEQHVSDPGVLSAVIILIVIFTFGTIIALGVTWLQSRSKMKAIELLKSYAERGAEPPASVVEAIAKINWPFPSQGAPQAPLPWRRQTRADHLAHFAGAVGLALGGGAVILWRGPVEYQHPGWLLITAVFVAVFFAASALARLVGALTAGDGDR